LCDAKADIAGRIKDAGGRLVNYRVDRNSEGDPLTPPNNQGKRFVDSA